MRLLALLLTSLPAAAMTELPQCAVETGEGTLYLDVFDHGQGMVSRLENQPKRGTQLVVQSCHTGRFLSAMVIDGPAGKAKEYPETLDIFDSATGDNVVVTLSGLAEALEAAKLPVSYGISRRESCACAASYPGLRGTKEKFGP